MARAQAGTIRLKLLKIGAQIRITARKVWISMASSYPDQSLFQQAYRQLRS
jgi:L-rhamnose isomerase